MLSAWAWEDLRQASRLAHAQGVTLFMHGVKIVPQERYVSKGDTTPSKPRAAATTLTTTERDGRKRQPTVPVGDARDQPSKRQQRSAQRLQDHREKQRAATVHARVHARWLSIVHRRWLHAVWTEHRLALSMQDTTPRRELRRQPPPAVAPQGRRQEVARRQLVSIVQDASNPAEDVPTRNLCPVIPVIGHGTVCAHGDKYAVCVLRACLVWGPVVHGRTVRQSNH